MLERLLTGRHLTPLFVLAVAFSLPTDAFAIGAYSHIHISQVAAAALSPGDDLRDIMAAPEIAAAYEAGSMFPDSGYAVDDYYGELTHWPEFQGPYLAFLRDKWAGDFSSDAARAEAAFLLGDMSHGLADQIYDSTLMDRGLEVDGQGDVSPDELVDYFLVVDHDVLLTTQAWGPYDELAPVITAAGHSVTPETLERGMGRMQGVIYLQGVLGPARYLEAWQSYPWIGTHIYNPEAPGSIPQLGAIVAAHWQTAWKRLHGTASMDTDLVVATLPPDGAENFPVDATEVGTAYFRIGLALGWGVRRSQVTPLLTLRSSAGQDVPVAVRTAYQRSVGNYVMLVPQTGLDYDTEYTVELAAGAQNLDEEATTEPYTFSFRTRCAPEHLDDCPPLPPPLETGDIPTELPNDDPTDVVEPGPDAGSWPDANAEDASDTAGPDVPPDSGRIDAYVSTPDTGALTDTSGSDGTVEGPDTVLPGARSSGGGGCSASGNTHGSSASAALLLLVLLVLITGRRQRRNATPSS